MSGVVELVRISKTFPGVVALADVDWTLRPGRIHALVGENGAGKSTLINLLSGVLTPDSGEIRIDGRPVHLRTPQAAHQHGIVTVHQEVDLFPDLNVAENMGLEQGLPANVLGWIDWRNQYQRTRAALQSVDEALPPNLLAGSLTPAQRQMVEIAAAVAQSARLLILDEPTSSLSSAEADVLFQHLRRFRAQGTAIVYVSHRFEDIFALADDVTVLRDGRRVWSGPLAETSPQQLIALMVGREMEPLAPRSTRNLGPVRLSCQGLSAADHTFTDVNLEVRGGEVLGLYGLIGAGRSEWAQAVFGLRALAGGQLHLDGRQVTPHRPGQMARHGLAYVPEDRLRQGLCRGLSVRANTVLASLRRLALGPWLPRRREVRQTRAVVERLGVRLHSLEQPIGTLSGGNQQKVVLGRWLGRDPHVLILDEPTRGVDVGAKAEIHAVMHRLAAEGRALVLISSDLPEVMAQSDRVGVFREGRLVAVLDPRQTSAEDIAAVAVPGGQSGGNRNPQADTPNGRENPGPGAAGKFRGGPSLGVPISSFGFAALVLVFFAVLRLLTGQLVLPDASDVVLLFFCAVGAALVILGGGLDISLGAIMALSAGAAGRLWEHGTPFVVVVAVALGLGATCGLLNAALSLVGRVHPIVVTLGTMSLYRGLTLWWLEQDVQVGGSARNWLFATVLGLPVIAWAGLVFVLLAWLLLNCTVAGRHLYALGSNHTAARRVGISQSRVWLGAFGVQGLLAGLAGLLFLARSGQVQATSYDDMTLQAIAAAVVGGVAITGGRGSVWGVALGCLFLVALGPACTFLHIAPTWQRTLVGVVLVVAVLVDALWRRREA